MNNLILASFNLNTILFYFIYHKNKSFKIWRKKVNEYYKNILYYLSINNMKKEKKLKIKFILFIKELWYMNSTNILIKL